jgi:hypothetical protein
MERDGTIGSAQDFTIDVTKCYFYEKYRKCPYWLDTHAKKDGHLTPGGLVRGGAAFLMHMLTQTFQPILSIKNCFY